MRNPREEAELIVEALFEDYGTGGITRGECPGVDGREAILEMKEAGFPGWQEVEWPGFHVKFLVQRECREKLNGEVQPYDLDKKRHLVRGDYVWDTRFHANERSDDIPLGDVKGYNDLVKEHGGIGLLVVDAAVVKDENGDFRRWHEELKGGSSEYSLERERDGRPPRERKSRYLIVGVYAYFFTLDDLNKGIMDGWTDDDFQRTMRNANGARRKSKYLLKGSEIPDEHLLFVKNFNMDPEEFEEQFPGNT
ncbi:hypothetical protein [Methanoculleus sp. UBA430]|jgi:hypothetical protein|uniref:hypothetical protein n=1 Tax=Methanoculleus sp. UBA430 TaxID=1915511 RepID=UPI0025E2127A|nr:hypothetical protein [Methanoculleus sp. UBA430]MDD4455485.1 hypothetical protein [Candidatus Methanomethylophilaceae archaeon]